DLEAAAEEGSGDLALAAADPAQRRLRVAADRVLDPRLQSRQQARLQSHRALAPTARTANPWPEQIGPAVQFHDRPPDCAARKPSRCAGRRHTAIAQSQSLVRREQAAAPLVKKLDRSPIPRPDVIDIDHFSRIAEPARAASASLLSHPASSPSTRFSYSASDPKQVCRACSTDAAQPRPTGQKGGKHSIRGALNRGLLSRN